MAKSKNTKKNAKKTPGSASPMQKMVLDRRLSQIDYEANRYKQLLLDPCNAALVPPTYAGTGSGMFVRVRKFYPINSLIATSGELDFAVVLCPATGQIWSTSVVSNSGGTGTLVGTSILPPISFAGASRAVAGCMKWVSTSSMSNRRGIIHRGYSPDNTATSLSMTPMSLQANLPVADFNGACDHEVLWFPNFGDQTYMNVSQSLAVTPDAGVSYIVGFGVDSSNSGGTYYANGYIEATVVWEIQPPASAGVLVSAQAPPRASLNETLHRIGNLGLSAVRGYMRGGGMGAVVDMWKTVNPGGLKGSTRQMALASG